MLLIPQTLSLVMPYSENPKYSIEKACWFRCAAIPLCWVLCRMLPCVAVTTMYVCMFMYCPGDQLRANRQSSVDANLSGHNIAPERKNSS